MLYLFVFVLLSTIIIDHGECEVEKIYLPYLIRFDASNVSNRPNLFTDHIQLFSQCETYHPLFRLEKTNRKGFGIFANTRIQSGQLILKEMPLFVYENQIQPNHPASRDTERYFRRAYIEKLTTRQQRIYFSLANSFDGNEPIGGIMKTNAFIISPDKAGIFPILSRINHACRPNINYYWNETEQTMRVIVTRTVERDDELSINYVYTFRAREERRRELREYFNFECQCHLCSLSDGRRSDEIDRLLSRVDKIFTHKLAGNVAKKLKFYEETMINLDKLDEFKTDHSLIGIVNYKFLESLLVIDADKVDNRRLIHSLLQYAYGNLTRAFGQHLPFSNFPLLKHSTKTL